MMQFKFPLHQINKILSLLLLKISNTLDIAMPWIFDALSERYYEERFFTAILSKLFQVCTVTLKPKSRIVNVWKCIIQKLLQKKKHFTGHSKS